jgi:hypothetical protein
VDLDLLEDEIKLKLKLMILPNFCFMIYGVSQNPVAISVNFRIVVYLEH